MHIITLISDMLIPLVILAIITYGVVKKVAIYDTFIEGAKDGMRTVVGIAPTLIGLMVAVGILRSSGFLDALAGWLSFFTDKIHFPSQLVPLVIVRMFSSSAATGLTLDIFKKYGTDSLIGLEASIIMCCTETIFYTMSVYYMSTKLNSGKVVNKTRWTLAGALVAMLAGTVASVLLASWS